MGQWHGAILAILSTVRATHLGKNSESLTKQKKGQPRIN